MNAKTKVLFCWRQDWKQFDQMFEQISGRHCSACATWRRAWTQLSDHLNLLLSFFLFSLCWTCHYLLFNLYLSSPMSRSKRFNSQRTNILIHEWTVLRAWNFGTECFWVKTSSKRSQLLSGKTTKIWRPSVNFLGKHIMNVLQLYTTSSVTRLVPFL